MNFESIETMCQNHICGRVLAVHVHWLPSYNAASKLCISCRLVPTIIFQHHMHSHHTGR